MLIASFVKLGIYALVLEMVQTSPFNAFLWYNSHQTNQEQYSSQNSVIVAAKTDVGGVSVKNACWIIGQQTIAERNVDGVEFRMKQTKHVLCTLKNLF